MPLGLVELGLVRPRIDHEQQVPGFHLGTFFERHLNQVACHTGTDVEGINGLGSPGEVDIVGDLALDGPAHRHHGRFGRHDLGGAGLASGRDGQQNANKHVTRNAVSLLLERKERPRQRLRCDRHFESCSRGVNPGRAIYLYYNSVFRGRLGRGTSLFQAVVEPV